MVLVGARGFEPPTPCSQSRCATGLRHAPNQRDSTTGKDKKAATVSWDDGRQRVSLQARLLQEDQFPYLRERACYHAAHVDAARDEASFVVAAIPVDAIPAGRLRLTYEIAHTLTPHVV